MEIYKVYGKDPTWTQKGIYMTRLAAAANEKELCIGMDTQVSDSICGDKQSEMIKILHNSNYCVCVLGTLELFTSIGTFKFLDIVKNVLTQTYTDIFSLIKDLQIAVGNVYRMGFPEYTTQFVLLWTENSKFYCYPFEVRHESGYDYANTICGFITEENKDEFIFDKHYLLAGEGINNGLKFGKIKEDPNRFVINEVVNSIENSELKTIGGKCTWLKLNKNGKIDSNF